MKPIDISSSLPSKSRSSCRPKNANDHSECGTLYTREGYNGKIRQMANKRAREPMYGSCTLREKISRKNNQNFFDLGAIVTYLQYFYTNLKYFSVKKVYISLKP